MLQTDDLFLLFTSMTDYYPSKVLIKKLYDFNKDFFLDLFNSDLEHIDKAALSTLKYEDLERLKEIKSELKKTNPDSIKKILDRKDIRFLPYCDKDYPSRLKEINDPQFGLFYKGDLNVLKNKKSVAIVGTRSATNYGINAGKKISALLAENKITIISGLASGIDASAHIGAVKSGKTIAVLGTGIDVIFPYENKGLYEEMLDKGNLILSEYPPGTQGAPWNFPQRNRIISALSDAVIVIEGDLQSGAMITARFAIKQGKPLFALPGPIDSPMSNGPNILIKSKAAELLTSVNDVLEKIGEEKQMQLDLKNNNEKLDELSEKQKSLFKILSRQSKSFDSLISETNFNVQELIKELSILELKGFVEKTPDGGYVNI